MGGGGHDPFDIFQSFFGGSPFGGGGSSRGRRQRRGEDVVHPLKVSLDDLYNGTSKKFPDSLTPEQCKALEAILLSRPSAQLSAMEITECEETTLHDVNMEEEMRRKQAQAQHEACDEDDNYMPGGAQRVQCAQQ